MLEKFRFGNFLSFKSENEFNLIPESIKDPSQYLHAENLFGIDKHLLKSIAVYGHNSHGKSNFLKALGFFQRFILTSVDPNLTGYIDFENFQLSTETLDEPSLFEAVFYVGDIKYRYGFKITTKRVVEEWLFYTPPKVRENYLFIRAEQEYKINKAWEKEGGDPLGKSIHHTDKMELLISSLLSIENKPPHVSGIKDWLKNTMIISDIGEEKYFHQSLIILSSERYRPIINHLISEADLGFTTIIDRIDGLLSNKLKLGENFLNLWFNEELKEFSLYTKHEIYDAQRKISDTIKFELIKKESSGTVKFLVLACMLTYAVKNGFLIIIDEMDTKFHSLLLLVIIDFYHNPKINNNGSQLVFTTHNTILLNKHIRRDQIMLVDKDEFGESTIRKAHSSKNSLRSDTSIEKEYRRGKIGGVSKKIKKDNNQPTLDF
jgi:uncharacterized protein